LKGEKIVLVTAGTKVLYSLTAAMLAC